jgi:hypothetical protein
MPGRQRLLPSQREFTASTHFKVRPGCNILVALRIPGDADQRSEVMAIAIPN